MKKDNVFVPVCYGSVSPYLASRDVNSDLFGCVGRPFCQEATLVSNNREGMALSVALGRIIERVLVVPCRIQ